MFNFNRDPSEPPHVCKPPRRHGSDDIYQLKVTLVGSRPPIWRRLLVSDKMTFAQLHQVIQVSMGWTDTHLHSFEVGEMSIGPLDAGDRNIRDERSARLNLLLRNRSMARYTYDFGDSWEHEILIEEVLSPSRLNAVPACTGGKGNCPPEECGGLAGFYALLEAIVDPQHKNHREFIEWLGGPYDPEDFSFDRADRNLRPRAARGRGVLASLKREPD